eukprot:scaffold79247_cov30-Tisochrysis_lutea.AAC.3
MRNQASMRACRLDVVPRCAVATTHVTQDNVRHPCARRVHRGRTPHARGPYQPGVQGRSGTLLRNV